MMKLRCLFGNALLVSVVSVIAGVGWSQSSEEPKKETAKPSSDIRNLEDIFSLIEKDLPEAFQDLQRGNHILEFRKLASSYERDAKSGDRLAQFKIGALCVVGLGDRRNRGQAAFWFTEAGGAEHPLAQYAHGMFLRRNTQASSESYVRTAVFQALASIGPQAEAAIPVLEREMEDDLQEGTDAGNAAVALGRIGEPGVACLLKALASPAAGRRRVAIRGLSEAGEAARVAVPQLVAAANDEKEDKETRRYAKRALWPLGVKFQRDSQPQSAPKAAPNVPELIQGLKSSDPDQRRSSAAALAKLNDKALPALAALIAALKDDVPAVRAVSAEALRNLRENARSAVTALIGALKDDDAVVRANAAEALGWIGPGTEDAVPHLIKAMIDADNRVRSNAARAFLTKWDGGERAIPSLLKALNDSDNTFGVPINAGYSLKELAKQGHSPIVVEGLVEYLNHPSPTGESIAIKTLKEIGPNAKSALPALEQRLKSDSAAIRGAAIAAISNIGGSVEASMSLLIADLRNDDWQIQEAAARSIRDIGPAASAAVPELISLLEDRDRQAFEKFQRAAAQGLAEAQYMLAIQYRDGAGTTSDIAAAVSWLEKAALQGHSEAQRQLGILYRQGRGVPREDGFAEKWYRAAAQPDGVLSRRRSVTVNQEAYEAALTSHLTGLSSNFGNQDELILSVTSFNADATEARHHQLRGDGVIDAFLDIYSWSRKGWGKEKLTPPEIDRLGSLVKTLPPGVDIVPLQQKLIVSCRIGDQWTTCHYDAESLPSAVRLLLDLIDAPASAVPFPPREKLSWIAKSKPPRRLSYNADGTLQSWGNERKLSHWKNGQLIDAEDISREPLPGRPIAVSADRVVTKEAQQFQLWDAKSGEKIADLGESGDFYPLSLEADFCSDGTTLVIQHYHQHRVQIWDPVAGRLRGEIPVGQFYRSIAVSADGKQLALSCEDKTLRIWDLETFELKREIADLQTKGLVFSPDGKSLAGLYQRNLAVWDLQTGEKRFETAVGNWSGMPCYSPDGAIIACMHHRRMIKLWDARDGRVLGIAEGHAADITALAISPDGKEMASSSEDGAMKVWNIERLLGDD